MSDARRPVFVCGDPPPDGTLVCPRCGRATVFRAFYTGEPTCDDASCGWQAGDPRSAAEEWKEPA